MAEKTIFQRIIDKEIPAKIIFEDDDCLAFHDIAGQAPVHVLVIPKRPIESIATIADTDAELMAHMLLVIRDLARQLNLDHGYRVVAELRSRRRPVGRPSPFSLARRPQNDLATRLNHVALVWREFRKFGLFCGFPVRILVATRLTTEYSVTKSGEYRSRAQSRHTQFPATSSCQVSLLNSFSDEATMIMIQFIDARTAKL